MKNGVQTIQTLTCPEIHHVLINQLRCGILVDFPIKIPLRLLATEDDRTTHIFA